MKSFYRTACVLSLATTFTPHAFGQASDYFNPYILKAVAELSATRAGLGYDSASYTQNLKISGAELKATKPPKTMCVAAQVEIISRALAIYENETGSKEHWKHVPIVQWRSLQPYSLRGRIWLVKDSPSYGTASALDAFGMGKQMEFAQLQPGAFVNLNRQKTGHAVVFLGYLDNKGNEVQQYGPTVAGFKYFSSQGKPDNGGFGYRYAFFNDAGCPTLSSDKKRDCGVIRSTSQKMLNSGQMLHPKFWNKKSRDQAVALFGATKGVYGESAFDSDFFNGVTTDD